MTIQTIPRPSETAHNRPDLEESPIQLDDDRNDTPTVVVLGAVVVAAIVAAAIAIALAIAGDDGRSVSDGSWEQAELRRMMALDQPSVDTSSDFAERQRQLRLAGGRSDGSFEAAEFARHGRLKPAGDTSNEDAEFARQRRLAPEPDTSHDDAEYARQRRLAPETDTSHEVAEFERMTRIGQ